MRKLFTLLAIAITIATTAQESTLLRLNYNVGDTYVITANTIMGQAGEITMDMQIDMDMVVKEVIDTVYNVEMGITAIKMDMNTAGMDMSYDSSMSEEDMDETGKAMHTQFAPMFEATIYNTLTSRAETVITKVEPNIPGVDKFTEGAGTVVYPKEEVKVGSSWTINKMENGMDMEMVYTVKSIDKENVMVDISGTISLMAEGTISGSMEINRATGNVNKAIMDMDMAVEGQQMEINVTMTSTKQ